MPLKYLLCLLIVLGGCSERAHFINDSDYRREVEDDFKAKKELYADTTLFEVFDKEPMTVAESEAMKFLYAYMPIGDITDYDGEFWLRNVRATLRAREETTWGQAIPEQIFRHFVLPVRVNNENLDSSRIVFYEELKDRLKGMSLEEAVLEVNHWCHEKVVYTPSDIRTSSPLASVRSAFGRCGEESTFTVAALRAVGIPARQVYTPRWAHTDDNHAWVEAWVDGQWHFMGACEPEPVLDLGWFNAPASRALLMHTKVFGHYSGPEEIMEQTPCYTEINVIDNYAPSAKATVKVIDISGAHVEGATVEFKIYNYAEFYTVSRQISGSDGCCSLSAGKGDMLVWASKDGNYGFSKITFGDSDTVAVMIDCFVPRNDGEKGSNDGEKGSINGQTICGKSAALDIIPPVEGGSKVEITDEQRKSNSLRLSREDSVRNRYTATFYTEETAKTAAAKYSSDESIISEIARILVKSRGNYAEIEKLLKHNATQRAIELLNIISEKDLRDTPANVLIDHLDNTPSIPPNLINGKEEEDVNGLSFYVRYVLNPRVSNELITPYKGSFSAWITKLLAAEFKKRPQNIVDCINDIINVRDGQNPLHIPVSPVGVWRSRLADSHSRDILFVSLARTFGIPARIEQVAEKVQYYENGWKDVNFTSETPSSVGKGFLKAGYKQTKTVENPKYYSHFTIAKILEDGALQTLNFETEGGADMGEGDTWRGLLQKPLSLDVGNYMLITGTRMASGKILTLLTPFNITKDNTTEVELKLRQDEDDIRVLGNIDAEAVYTTADGLKSSILNTTGRGYFVLAVLGVKEEPTNHALNDIARRKADFERWKRPVILLFKDKKALEMYNPAEFTNLPSTISYGIDTDGKITGMIADALKLTNRTTLPVFIIADTFGRVIFVSQGYTIGLGEQMMKVVSRLD
ncbi:MAG: transglutaminase-like domain-containing protein [Tannerella sp.]|jgi:hypothetical protein|nr:transglutaminase-like domain-containing protein [Tannerella sp.]